MSNPEFRRNLWVEFSTTRVLAAGLPIGLILGMVAFSEIYIHTSLSSASRGGLDMGTTVWVARVLAYVVLIGWGGWMGATAVPREINGRTWDAQRMSTLGAWAMAWGKLFGATAFVWLMGAICLATYVAAASFQEPLGPLLLKALSIAGVGLFCQAIAMLAGLLRLSGRGSEKIGVGVLSMLVMLVAGTFLMSLRLWGLDTGRWYGFDLGAAWLGIFVAWFFAAWGVVGVYRRMRRVLMFRSYPWVWLIFLASLAAFAVGLVYGGITARGSTAEQLMRAGGLHPTPTAMLVAGWTVGLVLYGLLVTETRDPVGLRHGLALMRRGRFGAALDNCQLWFVTYLIFLAVALVQLLIFAATPAAAPGRLAVSLPDFAVVIFAGMLFVTRDTTIGLLFSLSADYKLAGVYTFAILFILYVALPILLLLPQMRPYAGVFYPIGLGHWTVAILPVAIEVVVLLALLAWRWRAYWRRYAAAAPVN
jgi:hypothetical protein